MVGLAIAEADNVRAVFESHRHESNPVVVASLLAKARSELHEKRHPDPYIAPELRGGSKWERNWAVRSYATRNAQRSLAHAGV
jgi:NADH dehydrogenase (ubiquinone) 1 beta subcomplex subunit 9